MGDVDNIIKKIIVGGIITIVFGLFSVVGNLIYAWMAFHVPIESDYYTNAETNQTIARIHLYNDGFRTIDELNFVITNDCNLDFYSPKINEDSQDCQLKESSVITGIKGECNKFSFGNELDMRAKILKEPTEDCKVKVSYEVNWPGVFFRLSSSDNLRESNDTIIYGDEPIKTPELPKINFSFEVKPLRNFSYNGGRLIMISNIVSNRTDDFSLTGEWFNSSSLYDSSTYIRGASQTIFMNIQEFSYANYYNWISYNYSDYNDSSYNDYIGFMGTLKDKNNGVYQETASIQLVSNPEFVPFLNEDDLIKFEDNFTLFAVNAVTKEKVIDEESQSKVLLELTRQYLSVPKEIGRQIYFDENLVAANQTFYEKEGTASEFNTLYILFLRSIGIPAKLDFVDINGTSYPYTSVYINTLGWTPVDVYNYEHNFGQCFINCTEKVESILE